MACNKRQIVRAFLALERSFNELEKSVNDFHLAYVLGPMSVIYDQTEDIREKLNALESTLE